ncbi:MAG: DHH family phosphoesterase [Solobacterium sp.]|nr:DHH family phosphoesterase [Solobacterium sp.]
MRKSLSETRRILIIVTIVEALLLFFFRAGLDRMILPAVIILIIQVAAYFYLTERFESMMEEQAIGVRDALGVTAEKAFLFGEIGLLMYDDDYVITQMSELFEQRGLNHVGSKVLSWLPEVDPLISGQGDTATVQLDERMYEITRREDEPVLIFRDITEQHNAMLSYSEERPVIGIAVLDNYDEVTQYEDDASLSNINAAVRTPLTDYFRERGILLKRISNSRYFMVLNEKMFSDLVSDHFSILNTIRRSAAKQDVAISLSMAFARGTERLEELDEIAVKLIDLAQSRGGDQVVVQQAGGEVKYFGGSSEATEKRSRVRVRVMANTFRELISRSSNVIICGHRNMDFDCVGSAIGVARAATALNKQVCIIGKTGGIEEKLAKVLAENAEELAQEVRFVTESEAINQLQANTLTVMVDHHNIKQSNGSKLLESASKIAIIDHHRRSTEMGVKPVLVYIEAGASSACELITEMMPYISSRIEISELAANIMLAGMTIDTNRFHVRTGARTFEAAAALRKLGADPMQVDDYLKDTYDELTLKASCMSKAKRHDNAILTIPYKDGVLTRSLMSQVADQMLEIQGIDAVFVIANDTEGETAISARSNGKVNVQRIMEAIGGGGHMTAAAVQRKRCDIDELEQELLEKTEEYFREVRNEGNTEE